MVKKKDSPLIQVDSLYNEISTLIEKSKRKAIFHAHYAVNILFWHVGAHINAEILKNERAEYGK